MDHIDHQLDRVYQGRAYQTDNHAYQRRHRREEFVHCETQHVRQQRLDVVHAEVYDLPDQSLYRFDNRDHRAERSPQIINAKDTLPAQTLLDVLQVFQRERIGQSVLDVAADFFRFNCKLVEQL